MGSLRQSLYCVERMRICLAELSHPCRDTVIFVKQSYVLYKRNSTICYVCVMLDTHIQQRLQCIHLRRYNTYIIAQILQNRQVEPKNGRLLHCCFPSGCIFLWSMIQYIICKQIYYTSNIGISHTGVLLSTDYASPW